MENKSRAAVREVSSTLRFNNTPAKGKIMRNSNMLAYIALTFIGGALAFSLLSFLAQMTAGLPAKVGAMLLGG
jgi:hypothetical protein